MPVNPGLIRTPFFRGARLGALFAFVYITLYLVLLILSSPSQQSVWQIIAIILLFYAFGSVFGVLPAILVGGVTAFIIAWFLQKQKRILSLSKAMLIGGLISFAGSIIITTLYLLFLKVETMYDFLFGYLFYVGFPSVLYLFGGVWIGYTFSRELEQVA